MLHLGCGSGCLDYHLKNFFQITGVDLNKEMIDSAFRRNPECTYICSDMKEFVSDVKYDVVLIPDSIDYLKTKNDIKKTYENAFNNLKENGLLFVIIGYDPNYFSHNRTTVDIVIKDNIEVTFIENNYDPDTSDNEFEAIFVFIIRANRQTKVVVDKHNVGLFPREVWVNEMVKSGFDVKKVISKILEKTEQKGTYTICGIKQ